MYAVLGEDASDANTLKVLIRRIAKSDRLSVRPKGFRGCAQLLNDGARELKTLVGLGYGLFVIAYDADGASPTAKHKEVVEKVVKPSGVANCCVVVPVQELEAWLVADIQAVSRIITSWTPAAVTNPENLAEPKEYIERESRDSKREPRYAHAVHNEKLAAYIDLDLVRSKCKSFRPLDSFVLKHTPPPAS